MRRRLIASLAVLALVLPVAACGGGEDEVSYDDLSDGFRASLIEEARVHPAAEGVEVGATWCRDHPTAVAQCTVSLTSEGYEWTETWTVEKDDSGQIWYMPPGDDSLRE